MIDNKQLQALVAVHKTGSFEKAAELLSVTQSAVSQRIKQLEERMGRALLVRTSPVTPTQAGFRLITHHQRISLLEHELLAELEPDTARDTPKPIAIGINADSIATWFLDAIQPFIRANNIVLEVKVDDQDNTHELLRNGEVVACVTSNATPVQGCHAIPLGLMRYRMLASPALKHVFEQHQDWQQLPIVEFNRKDQLQKQYLKQFYNTQPNEQLTHRIPSSEGFVEYIHRGFAAGMIPDEQSSALLATGELVDLAPGNYLDIPLYWHVWSLKSTLMKSLTDIIVIHTEAILPPQKIS